MTTKDELVENIKEWLQIDNEIKELQSEAKKRRQRKKEVTDSLVEIMKTNEIDCFDMNEGKLIYTQNKVKSPLNKKHLLSCLEQYFENDPNIEVNDISDYIMNNRKITVKESIRKKK